VSVWTGTVPEILAGDIVDGDDWLTITSILSALTNSWTDYTPVWTASSVNPAIVNGTITSHCAQAGSLVAFQAARAPLVGGCRAGLTASALSYGEVHRH